MMVKRIAILLAGFFLISCGVPRERMSIKMYHWDFKIEKESPIYKTIQKKVGVDIEAESVPWSRWSNQLENMLTSEDVPDIFVTYGPGDPEVFNRMVEKELLLPLSPYLSKYPHLKQRLEGRDAQKINGEYYALPVRLVIDHTFFIRKDWLAECSLDLPRTVEDLYITAKAFKEKYNVYPITSSPSHTGGFYWLNPIFFAFNGGWGIWVEEEGKYIPAWISEGNKRALEYIRRLYNEGLLDPDFSNNSDDDKVAKFVAGQAGIMMHPLYSEIQSKLSAANPDAELAVFPPVAGPEGKTGMWSLDGFFSAVSINGKLSDKKREKALELLDYLYSDEGSELLRYGIKGTHWDYEGQKHISLLPEKNGVPQELKIVDPTAGLREFVELSGVWYPDWEKNQEVLNQIRDTAEKYGVADQFAYAQTEADKMYSSRTYFLAMTHYTKLIESENPEKDWDIFVKEFLAAGGSEMIEERNQ